MKTNGKLTICFVLLLVNVVVHVLSYFPSSRITLSVTWPLHVAVFVPFLLLIIDSYTLPGYPPRHPSETESAYMNRAGLQWNADMMCVFKCMPPRILGAFLVVVVYVFITFLMMMAARPLADHTEEKDGHYFAVNHSYRTEVTKDVRNLVEVRPVRGFSALWIFFTLLPTVYFRYARPALLAAHAGAGPALPQAKEAEDGGSER
ncbi:MAG: hypothetical protein NT031_11260 [Planctomycetota bacterium]|nr:hypothetical protein [Planctomycetota bacterium]